MEFALNVTTSAMTQLLPGAHPDVSGSMLYYFALSPLFFKRDQ